MIRCETCDCTIALAQSLIGDSTVKLNEAAQELAKLRTENEQLREQLRDVTEQLDVLSVASQKMLSWVLK